MNTIKNNLILGIGSQSAGTLLLHQILDQCTDIAMHPIVELHYFDTLYNVRDKKLLKDFSKTQFEYENNKFLNEYNETFFNTKHEALLKISETLATTEVENIDYIELFASFANEAEKFGEITPEYMLLKEEDIQKMSEIVGEESKIILLVRHPVERFLSALKMLLPQEMLHKNRRDFEKELLEMMMEHPVWLDVQDQFNQYEETYLRYKKYFKNVLKISYEGLKETPKESIDEIQKFLELPFDNEKAIKLSKRYFKNEDDALKVSVSIKNILEVRYAQSLKELTHSFPALYKVTKKHEKKDIQQFEKMILKKETPLSAKIENFDIENFLKINKDLESLLLDSSDEILEAYFIDSGLDEIQKGIRAFDKEYIPFDEKLYQKMFQEIKTMMRDPNSPIESGFDHFCLYGYKEIIDKKRKWCLVEEEVEENSDDTILSIHRSHRWLKYSTLHQDPFYVSLFLANLDDTKYLLSNNDVKNAINEGVFEDAEEHLIYHGIHDIEAGQRHPYRGGSLPEIVRGSLDNMYQINKQAIFLSGWLFVGEERKIQSIYLSNGTYGQNMTENISWFSRPDLDAMMGSKHKTAGFYLYVDTSLIDMDSDESYGFIVVTDDGLSRRFAIDVKEEKNRSEFSKHILSPLQVDTDLYSNLDKNIGPALQGFMLNNPLVIDKDQVIFERFGEVLDEAKVSIIVPLYGRIDFVEYQLGLFVNDSYFQKNVELIYVLDDPSLKEEFIRLVQGLYKIFEIPFSIVIYEENYGYAIANNIGVGYASTSKVLLLNSDVMPLGKGWLEEMITVYDSTEEIGALGVKLLFEDGAVQHAGMAFEKSETFGMWLNEHPGKGLPDMNREISLKEVPAVTAACLLIDKNLYDDVGGLSENYLLGDFEDSDLCLKLIEKGKKNYYLPTVSLCHLERQSQNLFTDTSWKTKVTLFNGWQHDKRWDTLISTFMGGK